METVMAMWGGQERAMRWDSMAGVGGVGGWRVGSRVEVVLGCWGSMFDGGDGREEEVWYCVGGGGKEEGGGGGGGGGCWYL